MINSLVSNKCLLFNYVLKATQILSGEEFNILFHWVFIDGNLSFGNVEAKIKR